MSLLQKLANNDDPMSLANRLRRRRFKFFQQLYSKIDAPVKILDLGGTQHYWEAMGFTEQNAEIHILNYTKEELDKVASARGKTRFIPRAGDATNLSNFEDKSFDIVFSNSVLEHVGGEKNQQKMLDEARRVGQRTFIQTPNYYFPIEPHFHFLGFQFLPFRFRVWLVQNFNLGWSEKQTDRELAKNIVNSCQLLSKAQLKRMAPEASIYAEKFLGLNKSYTLYQGWTD